MNGINRVKNKLEQIEKLIGEVKTELEILSNEGQLKTKKGQKEEPIPSDEELIAEYENLYKEFIAKNSKEIITEFVKGKSKIYLKAFCKANSLPIYTTKFSKEKIADEIAQWMRQRKVITERWYVNKN